MSRIHEALQKAVRERSAPPGIAAEDVAVEITREVGQSVAAEPTVPQPRRLDKTTLKKGEELFLDYEDFVKRCAHPEWRIDPLTSVFHNPNTMNGASERFRTLRSRLYHVAATRTLRRILVTSGVAGEGKTFVAANLAQSIVQQPERRVLLIDADLRLPRLHLAFDAPRRPGLAEYLRGEADEFQVVQKGATGNLCLVCAGGEVEKPSELLLGDRLKALLDKLTPLFDWVIIDSPPVLPVHDANDLARLTDGVLFVLQAGATHADAAERATAEFRGKNLLGVVLNRVEQNNSYGDYYQPYRNTSKTVPAV